MQRTPVRNLPNGTRAGITPPCQVIRRFGLRDAAATDVRKHLRQQDAGHDAHERRDGEEAQPRRGEAEQAMAGLLDRHGEEDGGQPADDADDDRQDQEDLVLAQSQLLRAWDDGLAHRGSARCLRPMSASAWSSGVAGPHRCAISSSRRSIRSTPASTASCSSDARFRELRLEGLAPRSAAPSTPRCGSRSRCTSGCAGGRTRRRRPDVDAARRSRGGPPVDPARARARPPRGWHARHRASGRRRRYERAAA